MINYTVGFLGGAVNRRMRLQKQREMILSDKNYYSNFIRDIKYKNLQKNKK